MNAPTKSNKIKSWTHHKRISAYDVSKIFYYKIAIQLTHSGLIITNILFNQFNLFKFIIASKALQKYYKKKCVLFIFQHVIILMVADAMQVFLGFAQSYHAAVIYGECVPHAEVVLL